MNFVVVGKAQLSSYVVAHDSGITVTARPMRREERVVQDAVVLVGRTIFTSPTTSPSAEIPGRQAARPERPLVGAFRYLLRATGADDAVTGVEVARSMTGFPLEVAACERAIILATTHGFAPQSPKRRPLSGLAVYRCDNVRCQNMADFEGSLCVHRDTVDVAGHDHELR